MMTSMTSLMYIYLIIGFGALYFFNRYLTTFFECREIPDFWNFFFWGVSFFWVSDALLPIANIYLNISSFEIFHAIMQPIGPVLAMYAVYKIEEDARNV